MQVQDRHIQELVADYTGNLISRFKVCEVYTESPIETLFLWALWHVSDKSGESIGLCHGEVPESFKPISGYYCFSQSKIGKYRADFAIVTEYGARVVVECDGHNFHEKTKEQAQRDKERDRFLQDAGWKVYRFSLPFWKPQTVT